MKLFIHSCCCSVAQSCPVLCNTMDCSTSGFYVLHHLPEFAQTQVHWVSDVSNHLVLCHPLLLLPSIFPSFRVFSNESALHIRCPKYWSFSFIINLSNEYSGLTPLWLTGLISLQSKDSQESSPTAQFKASILQHSAFFIVQLSHPYMTTGKAISLTRWTFVGKVMSLLFNMLSRLVIAFLMTSLWL